MFTLFSVITPSRQIEPKNIKAQFYRLGRDAASRDSAGARADNEASINYIYEPKRYVPHLQANKLRIRLGMVLSLIAETDRDRFLDKADF